MGRVSAQHGSGVTPRLSEKAPHARTTMTTAAALFAHNTAYPEAPTALVRACLTYLRQNNM